MKYTLDFFYFFWKKVLTLYHYGDILKSSKGIKPINKREVKDMKVFGKWLVRAKSNDVVGIGASFQRKNEAIETLNNLFGESQNGIWTDSIGTEYWIEKNTKEYK